MKKTLIALATLGAFAGYAAAASVTLYGKIDTGLGYTHTKSVKGVNSSKFNMASGQVSGSRWGLKGTEELGNGVAVSFLLENGFDSDTGALNDKGSRLFSRGAALEVSSRWGAVKMGRIGNINADNYSYLSTVGAAAPLATSGAHNMGGLYYWNFGREDNTIELKTPTYAGFTAIAHYSLATDNGDGAVKDNTKAGSEVAESRKNNRVAAIGGTYKGYGIDARLAFERTYIADVGDGATRVKGNNVDSVTFGGNYTYGPAKVFAGAQYVKHANKLGNSTSYKVLSDGEGYAFDLGVQYTIGACDLSAAAGYAQYKDKDLKKDNKYGVTRVQLGAIYKLSKRTNVYSVLGYADGSKQINKFKDYSAQIGMRHDF